MCFTGCASGDVNMENFFLSAGVVRCVVGAVSIEAVVVVCVLPLRAFF